MDNIISSLEKINEADQINILKDTICNRKEIIRDIKKLVNLYVNRDIVGIRAFNDIKHSNYHIELFRKNYPGIFENINSIYMD